MFSTGLLTIDEYSFLSLLVAKVEAIIFGSGKLQWQEKSRPRMEEGSTDRARIASVFAHDGGC